MGAARALPLVIALAPLIGGACGGEDKSQGGLRCPDGRNYCGNPLASALCCGASEACCDVGAPERVACLPLPCPRRCQLPDDGGADLCPPDSWCVYAYTDPSQMPAAGSCGPFDYRFSGSAITCGDDCPGDRQCANRTCCGQNTRCAGSCCVAAPP